MRDAMQTIRRPKQKNTIMKTSIHLSKKKEKEELMKDGHTHKQISLSNSDKIIRLWKNRLKLTLKPVFLYNSWPGMLSAFT